MRRLLAAAFAVALTAAAPGRPRSVLDLSTAPGAAGRDTYAQYVIAGFAPILALATACHIRPAGWSDSLETYIGIMLEGPRAGIDEKPAPIADYGRWLSQLRADKATTALDAMRDPAAACDKARRDPAVRVGDWVWAQMSALAHRKDPWTGAGGH